MKWINSLEKQKRKNKKNKDEKINARNVENKTTAFKFSKAQNLSQTCLAQICPRLLKSNLFIFQNHAWENFSFRLISQ